MVLILFQIPAFREYWWFCCCLFILLVVAPFVCGSLFCYALYSFTFISLEKRERERELVAFHFLFLGLVAEYSSSLPLPRDAVVWSEACDRGIPMLRFSISEGSILCHCVIKRRTSAVGKTESKIEALT